MPKDFQTLASIAREAEAQFKKLIYIYDTDYSEAANREVEIARKSREMARRSLALYVINHYDEIFE